MHFANVTCGLKLTSKVLVPPLQNGVHGEVRGHHSALQRQVHQDSTGSAWCVPAFVFFPIRRSWSCRRWCPNLCVAALTAAFSLPCVTPPVPTEPLLCKFADGGQKKRQNQGKYLQNGRPWARDGDTVSESLSKKETPKHELPASHSCRGSKSKTCFESCSVFPSSFTPWLTLFCVFFFYLTFVQAAVSVCMISQVLNPVHCFPREEWRLRMTRQPYKMGEWYAQTGWKQPHRAGWKVLVSQASWSDVLPSCGRYRNSNVRKVSCGVCFSVLYLLSQTLVVEWLHINRGGKSIHSLYLNKSTDFSNWKVMIQHLHSCKSKKVTLSWVFLFFLGSLCFFNCSTTKP